jgi:Transcriptional regulator, AbiEi antitoxin
VEEKLAWLASRSHGVVTRAELLRVEVSRNEIEHRLRTGGLIPVYRGVYRVGHRAKSTEAHYLAAVKACGGRALLFDNAAAHLYSVIKGPAPQPEVLTPTERDIKGITTRRSNAIHPRDATTYRGIPITTVPRTLTDLAAHLSFDDLARAVHEAEVRHGTTPAHVEAVLARRTRSKGAAKLRAILNGDIPVTLSKLERAFLDLLEANGLPRPITNKPAGAHRVDCRWPDHRLTVELDSFRYHNTRHAWEQDRRREREAYARGDDFRRYTFGDVFELPTPMRTELVALLT